MSKVGIGTQFRQGDVFIERIRGKPKNARLMNKGSHKDRVVLAYGEATGHAHAIYDDNVMEYSSPSRNGGMVITVFGTSVKVKHEEHAPITLPPGTYRVRRQREYTPGSVPRYVAD